MVGFKKEDFEQMFTSCAFGGINKVQQDFTKLVTNINIRCSAVLLVLKDLGALLKNKDLWSWKGVMEKMNWDTIMEKKKVFKISLSKQ